MRFHCVSVFKVIHVLHINRRRGTVGATKILRAGLISATHRQDYDEKKPL
jgi:hypothetical protein